MSSRHDRLELLDRYLRIPSISRQVTPEMIEAVRDLWHGLGLELTGDPARWKWQGVPCEPFVPAYFLEHYVLRHFYRQSALYAAIVSSRPM